MLILSEGMKSELKCAKMSISYKFLEFATYL